MTFFTCWTERGFIHQMLRSRRPRHAGRQGRGSSAYVGYDCTAPSLHVGNLIVDHDAALAAEDRRQADRADGRRHHPVGDPSGKDETRKLCPVEQIEANKARHERVFAKFLTFGDGPTDAVWSTTPSG